MSFENRTLYVGNLDHAVTEDLVCMLFGQLGQVRSCKMFRDPSCDPYCFIELSDHITAVNAITMMNDKNLQGRKMRVDWATGQATKTKYNKVDTSNHFHIYAGDLSQDIDEQALKEAFLVFGEISDCKIVKDPQTMKSRGYGFVVFVKKVDAETAISSMNGQWLGRKMIKVRWATRKPNSTYDKPDGRKLIYEEVVDQTTPMNSTIFCGGIKSDATEELLVKSFEVYGKIEKIKIFKEKGYSFLKFSNKKEAAEAIVGMHNGTIDGQIVRCSWGKDTGQDLMGPGTEVKIPQAATANGENDCNELSPSPVPQQQRQQPPQPQQQQQQMGYWPYYPQQMGYNQMNYNQYYGYQPQGNPGYMWMGWGQQGWNGQPPQPPQPPQSCPPGPPPTQAK